MSSELEQFDGGYKPAERKGTFRPGINSLADGDYTFTISEAVLDRTIKTQELILRLGLKTKDHDEIEHAYFFKSQQAVDQLGADLCILGFDADKWQAPARPFSKELPKAVARMPGIVFQAHKKSKLKDEKKPGGEMFHNLYIRSLVSGAPAMPKDYGALPNTHKTGNASQPGFAGAGEGPKKEQIPF